MPYTLTVGEACQPAVDEEQHHQRDEETEQHEQSERTETNRLIKRASCGELRRYADVSGGVLGAGEGERHDTGDPPLGSSIRGDGNVDGALFVGAEIEAARCQVRGVAGGSFGL